MRALDLDATVRVSRSSELNSASMTSLKLAGRRRAPAARRRTEQEAAGSRKTRSRRRSASRRRRRARHRRAGGEDQHEPDQRQRPMTAQHVRSTVHHQLPTACGRCGRRSCAPPASAWASRGTRRRAPRSWRTGRRRRTPAPGGRRPRPRLTRGRPAGGADRRLEGAAGARRARSPRSAAISAAAVPIR